MHPQILRGGEGRDEGAAGPQPCLYEDTVIGNPAYCSVTDEDEFKIAIDSTTPIARGAAAAGCSLNVPIT